VTDDLAQFLRDRLDEDEQAARACASAPWAIEIPPMIHVSVQARRDKKWAWGQLGYVATVERDEDRAHIARHDPARVLADIEAKRRIIALHVAEPGQHPDFCGHDKHELPCPTLRLLALPYADHPDYRTEWRP
jgi:hypothetical protein